MTNPTILRWSGVALASGGALTLGINVILTPLLPRGAPFEVTAASSLFLLRQGASALAAALLLVGCVGVYLRQAERTGRLGAVAFIVALLGSALVLAWEWVGPSAGECSSRVGMVLAWAGCRQGVVAT
jgi:hypothetical protein